MNRYSRHHLMATLLCVVFTAEVHAQGTAFTYQGRLDDNGTPANGVYSMRFAIYDASSGGSQRGPALTNNAVSVSNGLFTVALDFGTEVFDGTDRWLEISAATNGAGVFTTLTPRQPVTTTPYAIKAVNAMTVDMGVISDPTFVGTTTGAPLELSVNNEVALRLESTASTPNIVSGAPANSAAPGVEGAVIAGGGLIGSENNVTQDWGVIGGGSSNLVGAIWATVGGGRQNRALASYATVAGGYGNLVEPGAVSSFIGGGYFSVIDTNSNNGTIGGGVRNRIGFDSDVASIGGGIDNSVGAGAPGAVVGGGQGNRVTGQHSTISGGILNTNTGLGAMIGGGNRNNTAANDTVIAGGTHNQIGVESIQSTIGGGNGNRILTGAAQAVIGGGFLNLIGTNSFTSTISGGEQNMILSNAPSAFIGGGSGNLIKDDAGATVIVGGILNQIGSASDGSSILGGFNNLMGSNSASSVIGGGAWNRIDGTSMQHCTLGGGYSNQMFGIVLGGVVAGGYNNRVSFSDSGSIGGGNSNVVTGSYGTVPGGDLNQATSHAFAAGHRAKAYYPGSFVWADSTEDDFASTTNDQFLVRANGGAVFETAGAGMTLDGAPVLAGQVSNAQLANGSVTSPKLASSIGVWTQSGGNVYRSTGTVGIGTAAPAVPLHVAGGSDTSVSGGGHLVLGNTNSISLSMDGNEIMARSNGVFSILFLNADGGNVSIGTASPDTTYRLRVNGSVAGVGAYNNISDARYKKNIRPLDGALDAVLHMRGVSFDWKQAEHPDMKFEDRRQLGFVAQELAEVLPEAVSSDTQGTLSVAYTKVVPVLVEAIKEQNQQSQNDVQELREENTLLRQEIQELRRMMTALTGKGDQQ